jgi:hypothetical protein
MRKRFAWILPVVCAFVLSSCYEKRVNRTAYYPVDSLINAQIHYLVASKASVRKVAVLKDREDKSEFVPSDSTIWNQELGAFRELETINKPINSGLYIVKDEADSKSNLRVRSFTPKGELQGDMAINFLKIYYQDSLQKIRRLEAMYQEDNAMYRSTRQLIMEFDRIGFNPVLTYYSISGGQKIVLGDSVRYTVNAGVSIPMD